MNNVTNKAVENVNNEFKQKYNTSFTKLAKKYVGQSKESKMKDVGNTARTVLKECEKRYSETSVGRYIYI